MTKNMFPFASLLSCNVFALQETHVELSSDETSSLSNSV